MTQKFSNSISHNGMLFPIPRMDQWKKAVQWKNCAMEKSLEAIIDGASVRVRQTSRINSLRNSKQKSWRSIFSNTQPLKSYGRLKSNTLVGQCAMGSGVFPFRPVEHEL